MLKEEKKNKNEELKERFESQKRFDKKLKEEIEKIEKEKEEHKKKIEQEKEEFINFHKAEVIFENKIKQRSFFIKIIIFSIIFFAIGILTKSLVDYFQKTELEKQNRKVLTVKLQEKEIFKEILKEESKKKNIKNGIEKKGLISNSFGVFLISLENGVEKKTEIFSKNKDEKVSLASVTKLMSTIVALEKDKNKDIVITKKALQEFGDSGLFNNEIFKIKDLITLMLSISSNDAARAISESYDNTQNSRKNFISKMNKKAEEIGMDKTLFFSESGLDVNGLVGGAYSSVSDLEKLIFYFYKKYPKVAKRTTKFKDVIFSKTNRHVVRNTNILLKDDNNFLLSKTGYTDLTGGNLVTIYKIDEKNKIIIIVLNSTKEGRFEDTKIIINTVKKYLNII